MIDFFIKNKELINILSGIGTFLSSIVAIYTLREVIKQRLSTYKPEILIKSFVVYISKSPLELKKDELLLYKTDNFNEYIKNDDKINGEYSVSCLYKVENLGFGPAKKIKLVWTYDTERALKLIEEMLPERYFFERFDSLNYFFLIDKQNEEFHFSITNQKTTVQNIDYITPINIKEHSHFHSIPKEIILTYFLFFIIKYKLTESKSENFYTIPSLNELPIPMLNLRYEDINGKVYKKDFQFNISLTTTQIDEYLIMNKEFGYLLFELD